MLVEFSRSKTANFQSKVGCSTKDLYNLGLINNKEKEGQRMGDQAYLDLGR